ncbi:MAG TPA: hypothetical protein DEB39_00810, partial [Planctomycetaceae bacterium]|nr:hypothetical protein [Planctomycetaceae bacterium]
MVWKRPAPWVGGAQKPTRIGSLRFPRRTSGGFLYLAGGTTVTGNLASGLGGTFYIEGGPITLEADGAPSIRLHEADGLTFAGSQNIDVENVVTETGSPVRTAVRRRDTGMTQLGADSAIYAATTIEGGTYH